MIEGRTSQVTSYFVSMQTTKDNLAVLIPSIDDLTCHCGESEQNFTWELHSVLKAVALSHMHVLQTVNHFRLLEERTIRVVYGIVYIQMGI